MKRCSNGAAFLAGADGFVLAARIAPPSPRLRGEGRDEGASPLGSESRIGPLTPTLSPHAGRGRRKQRALLLASCAIASVAMGTTLQPRPAQAQFVCVGNTNGATVPPARQYNYCYRGSSECQRRQKRECRYRRVCERERHRKL